MCGNHILHCAIRIDGPFRAVFQAKLQQKGDFFFAKAGDNRAVLKGYLFNEFHCIGIFYSLFPRFYDDLPYAAYGDRFL